MKKTKQAMLALGIMIVSVCSNPFSGFAQSAQLVDTGTVISNIDFTDINGRAFTLYDYLDEGYTVIIELGLTTCPLCWNFKEAGVFDQLYAKYGPSGEVAPKKIMPMFIECNPGTTDADLRGTGSNTQGDWVTGHDYPIIDLTSENAHSTLSNFFASGPLSYTTPTFLIICPDRKVTYTGLGQFSMNEAVAKAFMEGRCASAVGIEDVQKSIVEESVVLYPNPVTDKLNIEMESSASTTATLTITNLLGQMVQQEKITMQQGTHVWTVATEGLTTGFYLFSITTDQGAIVRQFVKK